MEKKKKYKLHPMDVVTIVFTAIIVGIMGYVIYDQFSSGGSRSDNATGNVTPPASQQDSAPSPTPTATAEPVLSDIGNNYGNITNDAMEALINNREYFISSDGAGKRGIYVSADDTTVSLITTEAHSINVINDYIKNADTSNTKSYYVFYINGDGKICYVYDSVTSASSSDSTPESSAEEAPREELSENVFADGSYRLINVSGEYIYYLGSDGDIGKISILDKSDTPLSSERKYSNFCIYYGIIYACGADDGFIYQMPSNPSSADSASPSPTATASPESKEKLLVDTACSDFVLDNDWIYAVTADGIVRYVYSNGARDSLSDVKADAVNVRNNVIYYTAGGKLYRAANAEKLLTGDVTEIGAVSSDTGIYAQEDTVYILNENGVLMKSEYDRSSKTHGEFKAMS